MPERKRLAQGSEDISIGKDHQDLNQPARLRFWKIDQCFKCPVVGACLTLSEQRQLLKKAGVSIKRKSPFEIHETLVASSESENRLSKRVDNLLSRKFNEELASLRGLDDKAFMDHWKAAFKAGDYQGVLWAAATRPWLAFEYKTEIFGMVHMAMHANGEQSGKLKQRLTSQQEQLNAMDRKLSVAIRAKRAAQKETRGLAQACNALKARLATAQKEKKQLEEELAELRDRDLVAELEQENRRLLADLDALSDKGKSWVHQIAFLKEQNTRLSMELERQRESNERYRKEVQKILIEALDLNQCDARCPSFNLCNKRILIVGGITRMESLFREFIEGRGGVFEYHDGYVKGGRKNLENRFKRADVVLCPVNCNSHAACSLVKNMGKKHNKAVHMLTSFSLSAVSQALAGNGGAEALTD